MFQIAFHITIKETLTDKMSHLHVFPTQHVPLLKKKINSLLVICSLERVLVQNWLRKSASKVAGVGDPHSLIISRELGGTPTAVSLVED